MSPEQNLLYENFIKAMKEKVPQRGKLTSILMDVLFIEKEAVYRRIRGEVPFTFAEVAKICKILNLSLDTIINTTSPKSYPFQLEVTNFYEPSEIDYQMHKNYIDVVSVVRNNEYSEMGFATSIVPLHFSLKFKLIQHFYVLRWMYQFGSPGTTSTFSKIQTPEKLKECYQRYLNEVELVKYTFFIWDELLLFYLTNDINYFKKIRLITEEEVGLLKQELYNFLDYLEDLTIKGSFSNGNKIHMYVSSLNFETTYSYFQTSEYYLTLIKTFTLNEVASLNKEVFDKIKTWIQSLKRTSTLISESDERNRILFFDKQRKFLEENLH